MDNGFMISWDDWLVMRKRSSRRVYGRGILMIRLWKVSFDGRISALMKTLLRAVMCLVLCWQATSIAGKREAIVMDQEAKAPEAAWTLWYRRPATRWVEALPVGNGRLGCMVFGGVPEERLQFNEDTVWAGKPHDYARKGAVEHLEDLRRLLWEGKQREAQDLAMRVFMSEPLRQQPYQAFGDLILRFFHGQDVIREYVRFLDLEDAVATTRYTVGSVTYTREVFSSFPHQVLVSRITADRPASVSLSARVQPAHPGTTAIRSTRDQVAVSGRVQEGGICFEARLWVCHEGGVLRWQDAEAIIEGAHSVTLFLAGATNYIRYDDLSANPARRNEDVLSRLKGTSYQEIKSAHTADHGALFRRVSMDLGQGRGEIETDLRVHQFQEDKGHEDPGLVALVFQYGRYLLIASSRPGSQPANLQGIWNDSNRPPWDSKWTVNINTQMNFWPAELTHLSECAEPLFDLIRDCSETGRAVAREHYGARGWVLHHNTDLWRGAAPINASDHGIWPTGGAWLCQHLWWRYVFSCDEIFLRERAYPILKEASLFFVDTLVEDPHSGWLICGPSNSPEQGGLVMGPTMDHQIIRALFQCVIEASRVLDVDQDLRRQLEELRSRIAPNQIGRHGQLQEWLEDKDNPKNKHRHVSHLWGLHPGEEITPETQETFEAAKTSLRFRGDEGTGWSMAWKINLWARLLDGNRAHLMIGNLLRLTGSSITEHNGGGMYPNLFDAHPPFQIDGNFGVTAGITEMLLQSHRQGIDLLPALPEAWPEGSFRGLKARGGFEVGCSWKAGALREVSILSLCGRPCVLRYKDGRIEMETEIGRSYRLDGKLQVVGE